MTRAGILLPSGVVQPFDLRYVRDDRHVMAYFDDHPVYEAVEAMIRRSDGGRPVVRAILTRHDQTQVDHVNDERLLHAARGAQRETCLREIELLEDVRDQCPRVRLEFLSHLDEGVILDVTSASPPDASRGGLTDPGRHAATSSLPIMWRGKSALAGQTTRVTIGGVDYPVPEKLRAGPHFVAHHGHFTDSHHMAILRAGEVALTLLEVPARCTVGAQWRYSSEEGERAYRITELMPDGQLQIERVGGAPEQLSGHLAQDRLCLTGLVVFAGSKSPDRVSLAFDAAGQFAIGIDGNEAIVAGTCRIDGDATIDLRATSPDWARHRPVVVQVTREHERILLHTRIGA